MYTTFGDYYKETDGLFFARLDFLSAVQRVKKEVSEDLSQNVFPIYKKYASRVLNKSRKHKQLANHFPPFEQIHWIDLVECAEAKPLKKALAQWAFRHRLVKKTGRESTVVEWVMDEALTELMYWNDVKEVSPDFLRWYLQSSVTFAFTKNEIPFLFQHEGWAPDRGHWSNFVEQIKADFNSRLQDYGNSLRGLAEERGLKRAPRKDQRLHFEWLALHMVKRKSYLWIARKFPEEGVSDENRKSTVKDGIKDTKDLLGL